MRPLGDRVSSGGEDRERESFHSKLTIEPEESARRQLPIGHGGSVRSASPFRTSFTMSDPVGVGES